MCVSPAKEAKKVGARETNESVWASNPVNFAYKCAQGADRHNLIVTSAVYKKLDPNDNTDKSCGCPNGIPDPLWGEIEVEKLGKHSNCMRLGSNWCENPW